MSFENGEPDGHDFLFRLIGIFVVIMLIGTFLESMGISNVSSFIFGNNSENNDATENFNLLSSEIDLGDNIVNRRDTTIFQSPANFPIGRQIKGVKGQVVEGPNIQNGIRWWRINYKTAPNGWVNENYITNRITLYTIINIIPITLRFLTPIANVLIVLIILLLFFVAVKKYQLSSSIRKKTALVEEQKIIKEGHEKPDELHKDFHFHDKHKKETPTAYESRNYTDKDFEEDEVEEKLPIDNLPIGEKPKTESPSNRRWANIQTLIKSYNQNDWKQAIIEADTILEEMLDKIGYEGNSIGEKLKKVNPDDFITLNKAWEAHKMRNRIAHNDPRLKLSKNEAERLIELYQDVFNEFFYI